MLRDPVDRTLSEWQHVLRGATWETAPLTCPGVALRPKLCLPSTEGPLESFLSACPGFNPAVNRQSRMLADLSSIGCYTDFATWTSPIPANASWPAALHRLFSSAYETLATRMIVFGLTEQITLSQYAIEEAFHIRFRGNVWSMRNDSNAGEARSLLTVADIDRVRDFNRVDNELLRLARLLFANRLALRLRADSRLLPMHRRLTISNRVVFTTPVVSAVRRMLKRIHANL